MALFDGKGNSIEVGSKYPSRLNGADVVFFGDSNVYYSAGRTMADVGSFYYRLAKEFDINSWLNCGSPGKSSWNAYTEFNRWATDEMVAQYNKETTMFLFWYGTNDTLASWQGEYNGNSGNTTAANGVGMLSDLIETKFPKAFYTWIIPPATEWSKWTESTEADERNMAEKMPLIITNLEKWGFPYLDMYHQSGITPAMLSDGVHLGGGGENYNTDAVYRAYRVLREYLMNR
jgi:hypothetical protein